MEKNIKMEVMKKKKRRRKKKKRQGHQVISNIR